MNTNMNTKKLTINALLLAIGVLLHQITPILGLPMQPDFALIMLFAIMLINKGDYKTCLVCGMITGIFTAMTTKFPGGQIPNILDKVITTNFIYMIMYSLDNMRVLKKFSEDRKKEVIALIIFPIGTLLSGVVFLLSAQVIVGLPAAFSSLFLIIVVPTVGINLLAGIFLYKVINLALKRAIQ